MIILIASDSYKECMSAIQITDIIASSVHQIYPEAKIIKAPLSDGGEGFEDIIVSNAKGRHIACEAHNSIGKTIKSRYGALPDGKTAIIEMAKTCALADIPLPLRNPLKTSSFGVGEQILHAAQNGYRNIIIGLGDTGTHDMGLGLLQALNFRFYDADQKLLPAARGAKQLIQIAKIDDCAVPSVIKECNFTVAGDVRNTLLGKNGAAYTYAPQKGATPDMVEELECGASNFAKMIKEYMKKDIADIKGGGAAGGVGAAVSGLLSAKIKSGINLAIRYSSIEQHLRNGVDLVITGEGKMDGQSLKGKAPIGMSKLCAKYNTPIIAFCGQLGKSRRLQKHFSAIKEISPRNLTLTEAIRTAPQNLKTAVEKTISEFFAVKTD